MIDLRTKCGGIIVNSWTPEYYFDSQLMKANLLPMNGIRNDLINMFSVNTYQGGEAIPFGLAHIEEHQKNLLLNCVHEVSTLDLKLRQGFQALFDSQPDQAARLLRRSLNLVEGSNHYIEKLIAVLSQNPALCYTTTLLYRIDGLDGGRRIIVNEVNANPIGGMWLGELAIQHHYRWKSSFGIEHIPDFLVKNIIQHAGDGAYFHPVRAIKQSSSYAEKLLLAHRLISSDLNFFMGTLDSLVIKKDGVFINWNDRCHKVGYIGGLSSPEIFEKKPELLDMVLTQKVHCPAIIDNILSLANKGMLTLLTDMREDRIDPALLQFSKKDLVDSNPFPNTYWLLDAKGNDRSFLFRERNMVAKPIDGVGGAGIIFSADRNKLEKLNQTSKLNYLIQDYYPSFKMTVDNTVPMFGSLDPYFIYQEGKAQLSGVLVRCAKKGLLPNLTANSKQQNQDHTKNYLFSMGVQ